MAHDTANSDSIDKEDVKKLEALPLEHNRSDSSVEDVELTKKIKRVVRKIDLRLLPILSITYSFSLIDRVNLANARIAGADEALGLSIGNRYSLLSMIFFIPYVLCQMPANWTIRKIGATLWLGAISVSFSVVTVGSGFVKSWTSLLGCRIILGALEAGYYPGCVYLLSCWYCRYEIQLRYSLFFLVGLLASGFGGLLALGLSQMDGLQGIAGWRWIYIIEGTITIALGLLGFVLIVDFPHRATRPNPITKKSFLTAQEAELVLERIDRDRADAVVDEFTFWKVVHVLKDWHIWEFCFINMLNNIVTYSYNYFLPIILEAGLGYSENMAQLLSFPPYPVGAVWMLTCAYLCDRFHVRGPCIIFNGVLAAIGIALTAFLEKPGVRYFGVFLGIAAVSANVTTILSYQHNNITGHTKRAVASAMLIGAGAVGGIIATNIFRQQDYPTYRPGLWTAIGTQITIIILVAKNIWLFSRHNRLLDQGKIAEDGPAGFRYTW